MDNHSNARADQLALHFFRYLIPDSVLAEAICPSQGTLLELTQMEEFRLSDGLELEDRRQNRLGHFAIETD
jgi:hypothetical protein